MNDALYAMRLPGNDCIYHVRGRQWFSSIRTGHHWILTPEIKITESGTDVRFVRLKIEPGTSADFEEITDPILARVAGALVDMAFDTFKHKAAGSTVKTGTGRVVKKMRFGEVEPPKAWKVFVCLAWPDWERNKTPWKERAAQLAAEGLADMSANTLQQDCRRMGLC